MDTTVTSQLNNEIEKLKVGDYTSYQNFYSQTSGYIYQIVCSNVGEQETANRILNEVYTDIYNTIGTELTDNSRFFEWAGNKAQTVTDTYIVTHNIVVNKESKDTLDKVAVAAATNVGMNVLDGSWNAAGAVVEEGTGQIGYVATAGESGQVGFGSAAGQSGQVGYGTASREGGQAGYGEDMSCSMNRPDNAMPNNGNMPGNNVPGNVVSGGMSKPLTGAIAKPAMSIGAKVAIGIATAAVVIGGVVATVTLANKDKEDEDTTTAIEAFSDDGTTELATDIGTDVESEETTEEPEYVGDEKERFTAYYAVAKQYIEKYPTMYQDGASWGREDQYYGVFSMDLVDINQDGNKELFVWYRDGADKETHVMLDLYDYVDGNAKLFASVDCGKNTRGTLENHEVTVRAKEDGSKYIYVIESGAERMYCDSMCYTAIEYTDINNVVVTSCLQLNLEGTFLNGEKCEYSVFDENKKRFDAGTIEKGYYWNPAAALLKHRCVRELAKAAGDNTFETDDPVTITASDEFTYVTSVNKYNETYGVKLSKYENNDMYQNEISPDGKTLHIRFVLTSDQATYDVFLTQEDVDVLYTYVEDVLLPVGKKYEDSNGGDAEKKTYFWTWNTPDDFVNLDRKQLLENVVTEQEFNEMVNALMGR